MADREIVLQKSLPNDLAAGLVPGPNTPDQYITVPFSGRWLPDADPIDVGIANYKTLQNVRYRGSGTEGDPIRMEGIRGSTVINSAGADASDVRAGIQLRVPDNTAEPATGSKSYLVVSKKQGDNYHTLDRNEAVIGATTAQAFVYGATIWKTDSATSLSPHFSTAPGGNICYCNGRESLIWGGEEMMPAGVFIVDDNSFTNPVDYTDAMRNKNATAGEIMPITGLSYVKLLMHMDGTSGSTTFTDSIGTHTPANGTNSDAQIDVASKQFGSGSVKFAQETVGKNDYITIPDHADFYFGTSKFSVDFWVKFRDVLATGKAWGLLGQWVSNVSHWMLRVERQAATYGSELFVNGDCSADSFTKGGLWTFNTNHYEHTAHTTWSNLTQTVMTVGTRYRIQFDITACSAGYLAVYNGADVTGSPLAAVTTHVYEFIAAGTSGGIRASSNFVGSVDNFSLTAVTGAVTDDLDGWEFQFYVDGVKLLSIAPDNFRYDVYNHIALVRGWGGNANDWALLINGGSPNGEGTANTYDDGVVRAHDITTGSATTMNNLAAALEVGRGYNPTTSAAEYAKCNIDELCVIAGMALWTTTFVRPTTNYRLNNQFVVLTRRPIKGLYLYMTSRVNALESIMSYQYWNGATLSNYGWGTDGTRVGTATLAQDGYYSFPDTQSAAKPCHFNGLYYYLYYFKVWGAVSGWMEYIRVNPELQPLVDVWDGVHRQPISFNVYRAQPAKYHDYTLEVNYRSYASDPIAAVLDGLVGTTDSAILIFDDRQSALKLFMMENSVNKATSTMVIDFWDGSDFRQCSGIVDGTSNGTSTLTKTGTLSWLPPELGNEFPYTGFNVTGYAYRLRWSGTLSGNYSSETEITGTIASMDNVGGYVQITSSEKHNLLAGDTVSVSGVPLYSGTAYVTTITDTTRFVISTAWTSTPGDTGTFRRIPSVLLDRVVGIPAQEKNLPFAFSLPYKNRLLLCNCERGGEMNRVDYCLPYAPDVWNGAQTSDHGRQSIYVGDTTPLTGGAQLYNRFGSNFFTTCTLFKKDQTYVLAGDGPEDYRVFPVSTVVGCPAPETIDTVEVAFGETEDTRRNVCIFLSFNGPFMFDGMTLSPIPGIEKFFDPSDSEYVKASIINIAQGKVDARNMEYNLLLPCGSSATINNKWVVYDIRRGRWYEKYINATYATYMPQCLIPAYDTNGFGYLYATTDAGYLLLTDTGVTWSVGVSPVSIAQVIETGDFALGEGIWYESLLRAVKVLWKKTTEAVDATITYFKNTNSSGATLTSTMGVDHGFSGNALTWFTTKINRRGFIHRLKFTVTCSTEAQGWKPLAFGIKYRIIRTSETTSDATE